jgi:hypothetical protein
MTLSFGMTLKKEEATMSAEKATKAKPASNKRAGAKTSGGLSEGEREAIKARAAELKAEGRGGPKAAKAAADDAAVLAAIAKMPAPYRAMGERLHKLIKASAPVLAAKTWYGLPAYAKDGKIVCYLRMNPKSPYNDRYMTFGFNEAAQLDAGGMWPVAFALTELTAADEAKVGALVKKAVR